MNALVVYYSLYGNTRRLAEAMAEELQAAGAARAVSLDQLRPEDLKEINLVVLGSPTHIQNVPKAVRAALALLPRQSLAGKGVAAFDTSVKTWGPLMSMTAAHGLLRRLRKLGGKRLASPETFFVKAVDVKPEGEFDLLTEGELERARQWAAMIGQRAREQPGDTTSRR
jgi:flavodoxin